MLLHKCTHQKHSLNTVVTNYQNIVTQIQKPMFSELFKNVVTQMHKKNVFIKVCYTNSQTKVLTNFQKMVSQIHQPILLQISKNLCTNSQTNVVTKFQNVVRQIDIPMFSQFIQILFRKFTDQYF